MTGSQKLKTGSHSSRTHFSDIKIILAIPKRRGGGLFWLENDACIFKELWKLKPLLPCLEWSRHFYQQIALRLFVEIIAVE